MDAEYDVVVCGTGLKECMLSGLLSVAGKKVLHVDRNGYYGGESASLNLTNLYSKFTPGNRPPESLGANRNWNVDLIPKFVMSSGALVKILLYTKVTHYLEWQVVEGTYVYQYQQGGYFSSEKFIHKVPATEYEILSSPLMPLLEKNRCRGFFQFCAQFNYENPKTYASKLHPDKTTCKELFDYYGLQENTIDFVGHAVALYTSDDYLSKPYGPTIGKIKLYMSSISRYGKSPFVYPVYGLGGIPEAFSRLCALNGGTFMLNAPIKKIVYGEDGKVIGVENDNGEIAKCNMVVCDPSYVINDKTKNKVKPIQKVIRVICILDHPIPNTEKCNSCQIIIPQKQLKRKHDIYVTEVSHTHGVALQGKYIALVSTTVETDDPEKEVQPGITLLGDIREKFVNISTEYLPTDDGKKDNVYVSKSFDATSHFETATADVLDIYERMFGHPLDLDTPSDNSK